MFVEYFTEHAKVSPYGFLSHILQNKEICHIASCCIYITEEVDNLIDSCCILYIT